MFTANMIFFIEYLRHKGIDHGWLSMVTISEFSNTVSVDFGTYDGDLVGTISADFDEINKTKTPNHLALKLFNQMKERGFTDEHFEKTV